MSATQKTSLAALVAVLLGAAMLFAVNVVTAPGSGAVPLPDDGAALPDVPAAGGFAAAEVNDWGVAVNGAVAALDAGKKNEDNVALRVGQVTRSTSGGAGTASGRLAVEFAEDAQPQSAFDACYEEVTVVITPVRNVTQPDNAPVIAQVSENSREGFNIRLLNKEIEGISDQQARFTFVAYGVDRDADCGDEEDEGEE